MPEVKGSAPCIVLTGGGTAGHVTPNIALIPSLEQEGFTVAYIGSKEGIEKRLITDLSLPYYPISTGKLRRYFDLKNFTDPFRVIKGFFDAFGILKKLRPTAVFSKGGFVSVPVVWAAAMLKIPCIIHESDMTPGLANKLSIPFAKHVCCNFPETIKEIPGGKTILTGSPLRASLLEGSRDKGLSYCGFTGTTEFTNTSDKDSVEAPSRDSTAVCDNVEKPFREPNAVCDNVEVPYSGSNAACDSVEGSSGDFTAACDKPVILAMGGSLGAAAINKALREALPELLKTYNVVHLCGKGKQDNLLLNTPGYRQFEYVDEQMGDLLAMADIIVSRAGANAICEFLALNKPALLIPLSSKSSRGDQIKNALSFEKQGFALTLNEDDLSKDTLIEAINRLFEKKDSCIRAMKSSRRVDSVKAITELIKGLVQQ